MQRCPRGVVKTMDYVVGVCRGGCRRRMCSDAVVGACARRVSYIGVLEAGLTHWTMSWDCVVGACAQRVSWEYVLRWCRGMSWNGVETCSMNTLMFTATKSRALPVCAVGGIFCCSTHSFTTPKSFFRLVITSVLGGSGSCSSITKSA